MKQFKLFVIIICTTYLLACSKNDVNTEQVQPTTQDSTKNINSTIQDKYKPRIASSSSGAYISQIFEFLPAPGQFTNTSIAADTSGKIIIGGTSSFISLGSFGGYVTFGFDHSIQDTTGVDLAIYGNAFSGWSEPGIVMASYDANNNGKPDDAWYELAGSNYDSATTIKNYSITYYNPKKYADVPWKDNQGHVGSVLINSFHSQNYYPLFASNQDSIIFKGTLLPNTLKTTPSGIIQNIGFSWGYSDSYTLGLDPYGYDNYEKNQYNSFDISWARDSTGKSVKLKYIDFVKVYTGQLANGGILGEVSTEVKGAADLHILNK